MITDNVLLEKICKTFSDIDLIMVSVSCYQYKAGYPFVQKQLLCANSIKHQFLQINAVIKGISNVRCQKKVFRQLILKRFKTTTSSPFFLLPVSVDHQFIIPDHNSEFIIHLTFFC